MAHKRLYVRIPLAGEAILSNKHGERTKTTTIDISPGGIGVSSPAQALELEEYQINVATAAGKNVQFSATLIRHDEHSVGFCTTDIDKTNLHVIADLVAEFQSTEEFIERIDTHDLLEQSFIDDDGNEVAISFEIGVEKKE